MKVIIENGGLDCSLYNTKQHIVESSFDYVERKRRMREFRCSDLLFLNQMIATINSADYEEELRARMGNLFSERMLRNLHGEQRSFRYVFNGGTPEHDFEDVNSMEVFQTGNDKRLLIVNFKK